MIELVQKIPASYRQGLYFGYVVIGFVIGAIHVALASAGLSTDPTWLTVTDDVLKYASVPILAVAGINVTSSSTPEPSPNWPDDEEGPANDGRMVAASAEGRHKAKMAVGGVVARVPGAPRRVPPPR